MEQKKLNIRIAILALFVVSMMAAFTLRLMNFQLVNGKKYSELANAGISYTQKSEGARGDIVDRYGNPFSYNEIGYNLTLNRALMPEGVDNGELLKVIDMIVDIGEEYIDELPISTTKPYSFSDNEKDVSKLKDYLGLAEYATAEDAMFWLIDRYDITDFSDDEARKIAGVRYQMEISGFSMSVPFTMAKELSHESAVYISQMSSQLVGVDIVETAIRAYENSDVASHIIGTLGPIVENELENYLDLGYPGDAIVGRDGVEKLFEEELRGEDGSTLVTLNSKREIISVDVAEPAIPGNTVSLTIDKTLQETALQAIEAQIKYLNETAPAGQGKEADTGAIAAIDVKTGEVLVLASYPSYDISTLSEDYTDLISDPLQPLFNRATQGQYAPGSIFKPLVSLAGLNEEVVTADTRINCERVYTFSPTYNPTCLGYHGPLSVTEALRESCNVYFYDTGLNLGIATVNEYAGMMGLGVETGIELPEKLGSYTNPETLNPGDALQAGIGQGGNTYTPIQLAQYTANIARRGEIIPATLVKSVTSYNFEETMYEHSPEVTEVVDIDPEHFDTVFEGMIMASLPGGTAAATFGNYPITVASKTGTPQTGGLPNSTFIAFAPAEDPQIAVAVVIEKGWHGYTGAPVAKAIFDAYFFPETEGGEIIEPNQIM